MNRRYTYTCRSIFAIRVSVASCEILAELFSKCGSELGKPSSESDKRRGSAFRRVAGQRRECSEHVRGQTNQIIRS